MKREQRRLSVEEIRTLAQEFIETYKFEPKQVFDSLKQRLNQDKIRLVYIPLTINVPKELFSDNCPLFDMFEAGAGTSIMETELYFERPIFRMYVLDKRPARLFTFIRLPRFVWSVGNRLKVPIPGIKVTLHLSKQDNVYMATSDKTLSLSVYNGLRRRTPRKLHKQVSRTVYLRGKSVQQLLREVKDAVEYMQRTFELHRLAIPYMSVIRKYVDFDIYIPVHVYKNNKLVHSFEIHVSVTVLLHDREYSVGIYHIVPYEKSGLWYLRNQVGDINTAIGSNLVSTKKMVNFIREVIRQVLLKAGFNQNIVTKLVRRAAYMKTEYLDERPINETIPIHLGMRIIGYAEQISIPTEKERLDIGEGPYLEDVGIFVRDSKSPREDLAIPPTGRKEVTIVHTRY